MRLMYFPNRLEFLFRQVVAFPKDSNKGFIWTIFSCKLFRFADDTCARCRTISFVFSVFPDPDSPLTKTHWFLLVSISSVYACFAIQKICGFVEVGLLLYWAWNWKKYNQIEFVFVRILKTKTLIQVLKSETICRYMFATNYW